MGNEAGEDPSREQRPTSRHKGLSPELRRFLDTPRARDPQTVAKEAVASAVPVAVAAPEQRSDLAGSESKEPQSPELLVEEEQGERRPSTAAVKLDEKLGRPVEMQRAFLIIGALFLLGFTLYVGTQISYWKYLLFNARSGPKLDAAGDPFPGASAAELVRQALTAEKAGDFPEAARRFLAAKHKDLTYRGILFHVGKAAYDRHDFDEADRLLEKSIAFGENVDAADYYRALVAVRRKDLVGARRFFEAAATAAPFVAEYRFRLGEALRMDHHPKDAIPHYEHAALLLRSDQEIAACEFMIRMAQLEAGDSSTVRDAIEPKRQDRPLSVDWLMTAAALAIRDGQPNDALPFIAQAQAANVPILFDTCAKDFFFDNAALYYPEIARALKQK
jgi:tetratricopeptide (TPR) repeat protein